jgi:hypothetical protein
MRYSLFIFFLLTGVSSSAQVILENNPPSLKWYQVNTPHFRVLFLKGFDAQATRVANSLEHIREAEAKSLGSAPRKISVILQNQSAVSNAFVSILPRRSEFYAMPSQDYNFIGTNDWLDLLTSHEYRHVVQYQHATRGFNRLIYYVFGSISLAGMAQAAAPQWFWEGDAVATETAFTPSGRGKIPKFGLLMRTNLLEGRKFNYHKQYLRSYKHNIPDHYVLGYYMVSYLRKKTNDANIWGKITGRSWNLPIVPFAFSNAIKKETGLYVTGLYNEMADELTKKWKAELDGLKLTPFLKVNNRRRGAYTDYLYPQPLSDGSVLALRKGIGDIDQFVLLKNDGETVFTPGLMTDTGMLSAANNTVVWNEYGFDPRWRVRNYSLIKSYNLSSRKKKVIGGRRSRYASAAMSPDGGKIASIQTDLQYKTNLVILDANTGALLKKFPNERNDFYSMPRWSDDGKKIVVLKTVADGKTISIIDPDSGLASDVLPVSQENVGHPVLYQHYLFFNSPESGIDNIYSIDLETGKRFQVTTSRLGAYNPAIAKDGSAILYNDQTRDGLDVVSIPFDPHSWAVYETGRTQNLFFQHLVEQEGHPDILATVPANPLAVRRYHKTSGFINPYNWGFNVDNDLAQASVGITSRDILSTTALSLGYLFDINERTSGFQALLSYQGWYPIIDVSASLSNRTVTEKDVPFLDTLVNPVATVTRDVVFKWREKNIQAGLRIPLITTSSKYHGSVSIGNAVGFTQVSGFENSIDDGGRAVPTGDASSYYPFWEYQDNGTLMYNNFSISASRLLKQSRRDIYSKWGQSIELNWFETPFGGDFNGRLYSASAMLFFPGLSRHHSLWGYGAYQHSKYGEPVHNYLFRNQIPVPRGHSVSRFQNFYTLAANYTLPLWYPDIAVGPLLNFQRLRANVFFDYGFGESPSFDSRQQYSSAGVEAKLDLNIMRFLPQFDIGVRFSKGLIPSTTKFEVLVGSFNF